MIPYFTVGVYCIRAADRSIVYIGSSRRSVVNRFSWHQTKFRQGKHTPALQDRWVADKGQFSYELLEECSAKDTLRLEKEWSARTETLLNQRRPDEYRLSEETKRKQSESRARYLQTPGARESLSERARVQHENRNFGAHTWKSR